MFIFTEKDVDPMSRTYRTRATALLRRTAAVGGVLFLGACTGLAHYPRDGVEPLFSFPVTDNQTPYSQCLAALSDVEGDNLPVVAVGEVADKTGQINYDENGHALSQGATEMVMSALFKSGKVRLAERFDLRVASIEERLRQAGTLTKTPEGKRVKASDFVIVGALTELNYNIVSEGAGLWINGIGGGTRTVVVNVAADLRVIHTPTLEVAYVSSLQKQILGHEVEANIFRFFGATLVEFDAGNIRNEPLQLGVRSVLEMAVYQIMTDFLGLPHDPRCGLVRTDHLATQLKEISP